MGQNLQEVRPEPRNGLGNAAGNGMPAGQGHEGAGQAGGSVSQQQQQQQQVPQLAAAPPGGEAYFSGGHNLPPTAHHDQYANFSLCKRNPNGVETLVRAQRKR